MWNKKYVDINKEYMAHHVCDACLALPIMHKFVDSHIGHVAFISGFCLHWTYQIYVFVFFGVFLQILEILHDMA